MDKGGKPFMDCMTAELKEVEDRSLIRYVSEPLQRQDIRELYESFCIMQDEMDREKTESEEGDDTSLHLPTIRGQKEKEKEKQQQQKAFSTSLEIHPPVEDSLQSAQKIEDLKEIVDFWDGNGFGFTNVNAKEQLLSWLDDSNFLHPKEVILKAMAIACANNKRKLNYIVGILQNWENESLLTVQEIDAHDENQKSRKISESPSAGRDIPGKFILDLTAGEER